MNAVKEMIEKLRKEYILLFMLSKPISIRFSAETDAKLGRLADRNGIKKAELIRLCVEKFLNEIDATGRIEVTQTILSDNGHSHSAHTQD